MEGKGQLSVDYITTTVILAVIALAVFSAFDSNEQGLAITQERLYMKDIADGITSSINSLVLMGDGAQTTLDIANSTLTGRPYNITIRHNLVLLQWRDSDVASRFATSDLNFTDTNGTEIFLQPGDLTLWNSNGTISISETP